MRSIALLKMIVRSIALLEMILRNIAPLKKLVRSIALLKPIPEIAKAELLPLPAPGDLEFGGNV